MFEHFKKYGLIVATVILAGSSITFSVLLFASLQPGWPEKMLAGAVTFGLELSRFLFLPALAAMAWGVKRVLLGAFTTSLFVLSVVASVAFLMQPFERADSDYQKRLESYKMLKGSIESIDNQLAVAQQLLQASADNNYRVQAYNNIDKPNDLRAERLLLIGQLQNIDLSQNGLNAGFESLANSFGVSSDEVRTKAFVLVAVLIDVAAAICVLLLSAGAVSASGGASSNLKKAMDAKAIDMEVTYGEGVQCAVETIDFSVDVLSQDDRKIADRIVSGKHGKQFSIRQIVSNESVGFYRARKILEVMVKSGHLIKNGDGYLVEGEGC